MTDPAASPGRALSEAIRDLPDGLVARPVTPVDVQALTALMRATDIAGCGHSSTNVEEVHDELADPDCGWARGCATVWRRDALVGALVVFDGLASGRGWMLDVYCSAGDPQVHEVQGALIDSALDEGRARWSALLADPASPARSLSPPVAKSGCYASDAVTRSDLEARHFVEVRRFWRMRIDHAGSPATADGRPVADAESAPRIAEPTNDLVAAGYAIRSFDGSEDDLRAMHRTFNSAFLDHFDFTPMEFEPWLEHNRGGTEDPSQWLVAEHAGTVVGYIRGNNRYVSEGAGYVASIGVVRAHRGRGLARALLLARFADDRARALRTTLLHVDATNPTGATHLYESVGMVADSEVVWFHRPLFD